MMKGIYLVAVLSVAALVVARDHPILPVPTRCPDEDPKDRTVHLAYPGDCTKFYKCFNGEKIAMDCPEMDERGNRLHFNRVLQVCDWPKRAGCRGPWTPEPTKGTTRDPYECPINTNGITIRVADRDLCDLFYMCTNGFEELVRCLNGQLFDITSKTCQPPSRVQCGQRRTTIESGVTKATEPTTTTEVTTPKIWLNCPPKSSGITNVRVPHECQCNIYYQCRNGDPIWRQCPDGLHYDYIRQVCDLPYIVNCVRPIPTPGGGPTTPMDMLTNNYDECANEEEGMKYSHEASCSAYYECSNGRRNLKSCIAGLHFNAIIQTCDYPERDCGLTVRTLPGIALTHGPLLYTCPPKHSKQRGVLLPHERSCRHYYKCFKGLRIRKRCPFGTHYDYIRQICDYPDVVKCVRPIPPPTTPTTPTTPITPTTASTTVTTPRLKPCPPKGSTKKVRLPHECSCTHYYECVDGLMIRKVCKAGLHFDYVRQICDYPENVKCIRPFPEKSATITANTSCGIVSSTEDMPPILDECPNTDENIIVRLPHEDDCHLFYYCRNGKKVLESCKKGYLFNPNLRVCDFPENVKCETTSTFAEIIANSSWHTCLLKGSQKRTLPHEYDCTRYYSCVDGEQILETCLADLHYDYIREVCDVPEIVKCNRPITELAESIVSIKKRTAVAQASFFDYECSGKVDGTRVPHEYDCTHYYTCQNGQKHLEKCRRDLHFNKNLLVCDFPENAKCESGKEPKETTTTSKPKPPPETCRPGEVHQIPHETDCRSYYLCYYGEKILQKCPRDLRFNRKIMLCDFPENVPCIDDFKSDGQQAGLMASPDTCIGTCPSEDPPDHTVLLPNVDCRKFCMCSNGQAFVLDCPGNLRFDPVKKICNRPGAVVCAVKPDSQDTFGINGENSAKSLSERDKHKTRGTFWSSLPFVGRYL